MMMVNTAQLGELDGSLTVYNNPDEWNFYNVGESKATFQNLTNLYDDELFAETLPNKLGIVIRVLVVIGFAVLSVFLLLMFKQNQELTKYKEMLSVKDIGDSVELDKVEGNEVDSATYLAINNELTKYFVTLNSSDYTALSKLCVSDSAFKTLHQSYADAVETNYDIADCYSRSLEILSKTCELDKVNNIIELDGEYYCYCSLRIPTEYVMRDYVAADKYNITKYFTNNKISKENIMRYLLSYMDRQPLVNQNSEYLIKVKQKGDSFYIVDDNFIALNCKDAYTDGLNEVISILGK